MKKIMIKAVVLATVAIGTAACSDVEIPSNVQIPQVDNLAYTVQGRNVTLSWNLPQNSEVNGIVVEKDFAPLLDVDSLFTTCLIKRIETNRDIPLTVKVKYSDGKVSEGKTVMTHVSATEKTKVGLLIAYDDVSQIEDDDERAAATWFQQNVKDGVILTPSSLAEGLYPDEVSAVWIQVDRIGLGRGYEHLPASLITTENLSALKNYVKEGGNLLLTNQATQLISAIGRIDVKYAPGIYGDGAGGSGTDVWTTNAVIGSSQNPSYDHRSHPIFANMTVSNQYGHETYPIIGPGWREDHNCMWDLNAYGFTPTDGVNVVDAFEKVNGATVLSTWGHVTDYCCGGIIEFKPQGEYLGRCIAIGLSAYEWNQNSGTNSYQKNLETLTANCLEYLR